MSNVELTQNEQIRAWLFSGKRLTSYEAFLMFRCTRLSAYIYNMRQKGIPVITEQPLLMDGKTFAEYHIDKDYLERLNNLNK